MKKYIPALVLVAVASAAFAAGPVGAGHPSLAQQLADSHVRAGTALARLIAQSQDFSVLRPEELNDHLGIPLWLRVYWRANHPEATYSGDDPTGGYPRVIHEVHEWMMSHQNLRRGPGDEDRDPDFDKASAGLNVRTSGQQTSARSESAISINPYGASSLVIASSNSISAGGAQAIDYSADGGATWGQTYLPFVSTDTSHSDPTIDWTSDGVAWSATIGIKGGALHMRMYKSSDNGKTWAFDNTFSGTQKNTDKEMIWIDHSASSPYRNNIYAIWHNSNPAYMNVRTGSGWGTPTKVSGVETSGTAIGGDVKTNAFGDVFGFWPATGNSKIVMVKSTTGGASFGAAKAIATTYDSYDIGVPSFASRRALIYVAGGAYRTTTKDNVYATWTDLSGETGCTAPSNEPGTNAASTCKTRIWFSRSTDGGATWSAPVKLNNQSAKNDQFNQWLAVDETNGTIGVMYYDTILDPSRLATNVFYQLSTDDGVTWSAPLQVTTQSTNETTSGADSGNQYGDYNGMSGYLNRFLPSWTDRRGNAKEEIWTAPISNP